MNRFPLLAKLFMAMMPGLIEKLVHDTRIHEAHTIDLIERFAILYRVELV